MLNFILIWEYNKGQSEVNMTLNVFINLHEIYIFS